MLTVLPYSFDGASLRFTNLFAADDPRSTAMNVRDLIERQQVQPTVLVLVNCRPDRLERNGQMGEIVPDLRADKLWIIAGVTVATYLGTRLLRRLVILRGERLFATAMLLGVFLQLTIGRPVHHRRAGTPPPAGRSFSPRSRVGTG